MTSHQPTIVVGVDGSETSADALRWAAGQAELTGGRLQVIVAWRRPVTYGGPADYSDVDFENEARRKAATVLSEVLGTRPAAPVDTQVIEGHAAPALVEAARGADLLVVGSHGHGAFVGMLVGFDQSALRAACELPDRHRAPPGAAVRRADESLRTDQFINAEQLAWRGAGACAKSPRRASEDPLSGGNSALQGRLRAPGHDEIFR